LRERPATATRTKSDRWLVAASASATLHRRVAIEWSQESE
jgi:hypothetical protein